MCVVIMPKYGKTTKIFGIVGVMAKTLYGYWSGHVWWPRRVICQRPPAKGGRQGRKGRKQAATIISKAST